MERLEEKRERERPKREGKERGKREREERGKRETRERDQREREARGKREREERGKREREERGKRHQQDTTTGSPGCQRELRPSSQAGRQQSVRLTAERITGVEGTRR